MSLFFYSIVLLLDMVNKQRSPVEERRPGELQIKCQEDIRVGFGLRDKNHETNVIGKMLREMETAFNLLRAWDSTTLYEKSYFILVHFALLLLGIYSIKNRIFGGRQKRRPTSLPSSTAQLLPNDSAQGSKSQESNFKLERDLIWAKELASWILKNSYANDAISNWKSKINGRLLHNMSKV